MTYFSDDRTLTDERFNDDERQQICCERARDFWLAGREDGAWGRELLYALVYTAAHFGLRQTNNSYTVLADLMGAASDATWDIVRHDANAAESSPDATVPAGNNVVPIRPTDQVVLD